MAYGGGLFRRVGESQDPGAGAETRLLLCGALAKDGTPQTRQQTRN